MRHRLKLNFLTLVTATFALGFATAGFAQTVAAAASAPTPSTAAPLPDANKPSLVSPVAASGVRQFGSLPRIKPLAKSADFIVAVVNSESVTDNEVKFRVAKMQQENVEKGGAQPTQGELRKQALDALVEERVLVTYARDNGVKVDDGEVDRAIANIASSNKMTSDQLRDRLRQQGVDYGTFRNGIRDQITIERIREREVIAHIRVTDAEVNDYIAKMRGGHTAAPQINIAQILITVPDKATPAVEAERKGARGTGARARAQRRAVRAGGARDVRGQQQGQGRRDGFARARQVPRPVRQRRRRRQGGRHDGRGAQRRGLPHLEGGLARRGVGPDHHADARAPHRAAAVGRDEHRCRRAPHHRVPPADRQRREGRSRNWRASIRKTAAPRRAATSAGPRPVRSCPSSRRRWTSCRSPACPARCARVFGVHLIQVLDRRDTTIDPKQLREQANNALKEQKFDPAYAEWVSDLRAKAFIEYREPPV